MFCFLNWNFHGERELGQMTRDLLCVFVGWLSSLCKKLRDLLSVD